MKVNLYRNLKMKEILLFRFQTQKLRFHFFRKCYLLDQYHRMSNKEKTKAEENCCKTIPTTHKLKSVVAKANIFVQYAKHFFYESAYSVGSSVSESQCPCVCVPSDAVFPKVFFCRAVSMGFFLDLLDIL